MRFLWIIALGFTCLVSNAQLPDFHFRAFNKNFTAIINNESKGKNHLWPVYSDRDMNTKVAHLSPGDTVRVTGWSTWTYFIEARAIDKGYVSWKALTPTRDSELIVRMIGEQSKKDDEMDKRSIPFEPEVVLNLLSDKAEVFVGECFNIDLEMCVADENKVPLRFHNLGLEVANIYVNKLDFSTATISGNFITDVSGVPKVINSKNYTSYRVINAYVCPTELLDIQIPEIELRMAQLNAGRTFDKLVSFHSKQAVIKVKPTLFERSDSENQPTLVCNNLELKDTLYIECQQNEFLTKYKVEINSRNYLPPFDFPKIDLPDGKSKMISFSEADTLINGNVISSRVFQYEFNFSKTRTYDLRNKILLKYFDPVEMKNKYLRSNKTIRVSDSIFNNSTPTGEFLKENLILIDISKSMKIIEDYDPTRLGATVNGVRKFLMHRTKCDIGIIVFGAGAHFVNTDVRDSCYAKSLVDSIKFRSERRGTSISNALLMAINSFNPGSSKKNIVIIGDGDNTAGNMKPESVGMMAKKKGIKIFTIGIGTNGLVSAGNDQSGNARKVDNTFYDVIFKQISSITGGQYFWAKDYKEIANFLKKIFG